MAVNKAHCDDKPLGQYIHACSSWPVAQYMHACAASSTAACSAQQRKRHPWHFQKPNTRLLNFNPSRCHELLVLLVTDQRPDHAHARPATSGWEHKVLSPLDYLDCSCQCSLLTVAILSGLLFCPNGEPGSCSKPFFPPYKGNPAVQAVVCSVWFGLVWFLPNCPPESVVEFSSASCSWTSIF